MDSEETKQGCGSLRGQMADASHKVITYRDSDSHGVIMEVQEQSTRIVGTCSESVVVSSCGVSWAPARIVRRNNRFGGGASPVRKDPRENVKVSKIAFNRASPK